ncbi:MAG: filamentous hemagglutinin family protein [Syntrophobacteraceae bacterium]
MLRQTTAILLCLGIVFQPVLGQAAQKVPGLTRSFAPVAPTPKPKSLSTDSLKMAGPKKSSAMEMLKAQSASSIPDNTLPVPKGTPQGVSSIDRPGQNKLIVHQNQSKAVLDWKSFDIGSKSSVHFDQQKHSDWVALNRIYSANPSKIFGKLSADGKIYLINQNGILFGKGSQVNVHSMIASTLDIANDDFVNGILKFKARDYINGTDTPNLDASVINRGTIQAGSLGNVFLLGPSVQNDGTITTTAGQIGLAAGTDISIYTDTEQTSRVAKVVRINDGHGEALNTVNGQMTANTGLIGMYGKEVNQDGVIRAVTALKKNGQIELVATDRISTGVKSITSSEISNSTETADQSFAFKGGEINIGLDPSTSNTSNFVKKIVHRGVIEAPSGSVNMAAQDRVYLDKDSRIDVSGSWINKAASANTTQVQLNSVNLADYHNQKDGILKGMTITVDNHLGSSIGNISGYLTAKEKTALERSIAGGTINITSKQGDVIVRDGASLDFSGGGIRYAGGNIVTTQLVSGNKMYDISQAPETLQYSLMLNTTKHVDSYVEGADAGTLAITARHLVLDGQLKGSATQGTYQTRTSELLDKMGNQKTLGVAETKGGALRLVAPGQEGGNTQEADFGLDAVVLKRYVAPVAFGPDDQPYEGFRQTVLSTDTLNAAGLRDLVIYSNTTLKTDADAQISLSPGGSFTGAGRQILHRGAIHVANGKVNFELRDNITSNPTDNPRYVPLESHITLASGSVIDAGGQLINNSLQTGGVGANDSFNHIGGGDVSIIDLLGGKGIMMEKGAKIDVRGGFGIDQRGSVTGGDAGKLAMLGSSIVLKGDLLGHSLVGKKGGTIDLTARSVEVTASRSSLPQDLDSGKLILGSDQLDNSGFAKITLSAVEDLTINTGAVLSPSLVKLDQPNAAWAPGQTRYIKVSPDLVGALEVSLNAGADARSIGAPKEEAWIKVSSGAGIRVAPGADKSIKISAPNIEMAGLLEAHGGKIYLKATQSLTIKKGGEITAAGYSKPDEKPVKAGFPTGFKPVSGGSVVLEASDSSRPDQNVGKLYIEAGSLVDVSGSAPATAYMLNTSGLPMSFTAASDAGSIAITYAGEMQLEGVLKGKAAMSGLRGGTLSINSKNLGTNLSVSSSDFEKYTSNGFDDLTFQSSKGLKFSGPIKYRIGRGLTLDAPVISGDAEVSLSAPWIQLKNSYGVSRTATAIDAGAGLALSGDWIDVKGSILFDRFRTLDLDARRDIRLLDNEYTILDSMPGQAFWEGRLDTPCDLILKADHIYPTTAANFTTHSGGKTTILRSDNPTNGMVYSAGGSLTIEADSIEHRGYLAAPMGRIKLNATNRVYLAEDSITTTAGTSYIKYGDLTDVFWTITDKTTQQPVPVRTTPEKSVEISGNEVITKAGSQIDVSGGGSIFAYEFQSGLAGTADPLKGRYVIVPNGQYSLPGQAVYLEGAAGLKPGMYTILPESYAFLPGAMVVTATGTKVTPGMKTVTADGYQVVAGYLSYMGTAIRPSLMEAFEVQPATDVVGGKLGHFNISNSGKQLIAGDAGKVSFIGNTTVVNGTILAGAMEGYRGGSISLSGANAFIEAQAGQLPPGFNFDTLVTDVPGLEGTLHVAAGALSGKGFEEIRIGDISGVHNTHNVTMKEGAVLEATNVVLSALDGITIESKAQIKAVNSSLITPDGKLTMLEDSLVHASDLVTMKIGKIDFRSTADLKIDKGALNLTGRNVYFLPAGASQSETDTTGLYLTKAFYGKFNDFKDIHLSASAGTVQFLGGIELSAQNSFTIDAAVIKGPSNDGIVKLNAPSLTLLNTGGNLGSSTLRNTATLSLNANEISIGQGALLLDGFASATFNAVKDITFRGSGALTTGGDLNFSSARITTSYYQDANNQFTASNFQITAGGNVTTRKSKWTANPTSVPGGTLGITASLIDHAGIVDVSSGNVSFTATGSDPGDGIVLRKGSAILAQSSKYAPGGNVVLRTDNGKLNMKEGALIDVGAPLGSQGDAGSISIITPSRVASLEGTLGGASQPGGLGGSFSLDTYKIDGSTALISLYSKLGDFTELFNIRTRTGDLNVKTDISARHVRLTADAGNLGLWGTINASHAAGSGSVKLYAGRNLVLHTGSAINARGADNLQGGEISLSSTNGVIDFQQGAVLDVSGTAPGARGTVHFRASLNEAGDDVKMNLAGKITGAREILAEGFHAYRFDGDKTITDGDIYGWQTGIQDFMDNYGSGIQSRLLSNLTLDSAGAAGFIFVPGLEIKSTGNLVLDSRWDLSSWRYGTAQAPGVLTLKAAGNLNINSHLIDAPSGLLNESPQSRSWALNLIAGADSSSAYTLATHHGVGDLTFTGGQMVYTESAPIRFASGRDTLIGAADMTGHMLDSSINYNLGSYNGSIRGEVGRDLNIQAGAIQTATGNIDLAVGRDLVLGFGETGTVLGTIRTTGQAPADSQGQYWKYSGGGDITLRVAGAVNGSLNNDAWDWAYGARPPKYWAARYEGYQATQGLATMAGGNLSVYAGGDFFCQAGTFGQGDLKIYTGGDLNGRFLIKQGKAELNAMGNFGSPLQPQVVEAFDAKININAQGNIWLGTIVNPTIARPMFRGSAFWDLGYSQNSTVMLRAVLGNVSISGESPFYDQGAGSEDVDRILPGTLEVHAGGDILLANSFALAPSPTGSLVLSAGGDIVGQYTTQFGTLDRSAIYMSDLDPGEVYGLHFGFTAGTLFDKYKHAATLLHGNDAAPVVISAGRDIRETRFYLPKKADFTAGRDISDISFYGQNTAEDDITKVIAGRDIVFSSSQEASTDSGIQLAGPGFLFLRAAGSMDLGTTSGIQSLGNSFNPALSSGGATLLILSGYTMDVAPNDASGFFKALSTAGKKYSELMALGKTADAQQVIRETRSSSIEPFIDGSAAGTGDINMTSSQISTSGGGDIFILSNGNLNVGKQTFFSDESQRKSTGITTASGGAINIFAEKDVNVNESRVMTFMGGDITTWSNHGNINAGRGSKTAINASPPRLMTVGDTQVLVFDPPAVGSGIRALTYDPDGVDGPLDTPLAGDIYLFAPQGVIDAGEAGIAGRNVFLGATQVLNVNNISFTAAAVGVPTTSSGATGFGAVSGMGGVTQEMKAQETAVASASSGKLGQNVSDAGMFGGGSLDVKVISYMESEEDSEKKSESKEG